MTEQKLTSRTMRVVLVLLTLAMALQTLVVLFICLRNALDREIGQAVYHLEETGHRMKGLSPESLQHIDVLLHSIIRNDGANCRALHVSGQSRESGFCTNGEELTSQTKLSFEQGVTKTGYNGLGWHLLFLRNEDVLISVPVLDDAGNVLAALGEERSLVPVYQAIGTTGRISLLYLFLNLIVFATIAFFRMTKLIFRPIDKLVGLAESYRPDAESGLHLGGNLGAFRTLSTSLNSMLSRIESDNKKLRSSLAELEKLNRELVENQNLMIRSEKLASIGRLSSGLAHEIGNPLAIIQGYIELLDRQDLEADERHLFSTKAGEELERLKKLIRQMLNFARHTAAELEPVDIHQLLDEVVELVRFEKKFESCQVEKNYTAANATIKSDSQGLRQVILNCLLNSLDAMQEKVKGKKIIRLGTAEVVDEDGQGRLSISILDSGDGISRENLANVFDPFFTTKEVGKGTGLGLFVCYAIIEQLGGRIEVQNHPAGGAEVVIELLP